MPPVYPLYVHCKQSAYSPQVGRLLIRTFGAENSQESLPSAERLLPQSPGNWRRSPVRISRCDSVWACAGLARCRLGVPTLAQTGRLAAVGAGAKASSYETLNTTFSPSIRARTTKGALPTAV